MSPDVRLVPSALLAWALAWALPLAQQSLEARLLGWAVALLVAAGGVAVALVARDLGTERQRAALGQGLLALGVVVAVLASGSAQQAARGTGGTAELARQGAVVSVVGVVTRDPEATRTPSGVRTGLRLIETTARGTSTRAAATVEVRADAAWSGVVVGSTVAARGRLTPPGPGRAETARFVASGAPTVVRPAGVVLGGVARVRASLMDVTDPLSAQARGLVPGAAIGDTTRMPDDLTEAMLATSLTHITAVSGGHFAVMVVALAWCCATLRTSRRLRVGVTAGVVVAFVLLVRPDPSVLRAAVMGGVGVLGLALGRPARAIPALAATAVVLLVVDPWLARSYGFVLSSVATAGLVTLTTPIAVRLAPWVGRHLAFALAVPVAAQLACGPVLVLLAPSVAVYGVPANLLAAPALGPATVLGLGATVLAPWLPAVATAVAWCAGLATGWIALVARTFAALPGGTLAWPGGVGGAVLLAGITAVGVAVLLRAVPAPERG